MDYSLSTKITKLDSLNPQTFPIKINITEGTQVSAVQTCMHRSAEPSLLHACIIL